MEAVASRVSFVLVVPVGFSEPTRITSAAENDTTLCSFVDFFLPFGHLRSSSGGSGYFVQLVCSDVNG